MSETKQKQSECDSYRNINSVCDSVGDSLLPTSSAHSIIHFSNRPGANNNEGGLVYVRNSGVEILKGGSEVSLITQGHTLTFRNAEHVSSKYQYHV